MHSTVTKAVLTKQMFWIKSVWHKTDSDDSKWKPPSCRSSQELGNAALHKTQAPCDPGKTFLE